MKLDVNDIKAALDLLTSDRLTVKGNEAYALVTLVLKFQAAIEPAEKEEPSASTTPG